MQEFTEDLIQGIRDIILSALILLVEKLKKLFQKS